MIMPPHRVIYAHGSQLCCCELDLDHTDDTVMLDKRAPLWCPCGKYRLKHARKCRQCGLIHCSEERHTCHEDHD